MIPGIGTSRGERSKMDKFKQAVLALDAEGVVNLMIKAILADGKGYWEFNPKQLNFSPVWGCVTNSVLVELF